MTTALAERAIPAWAWLDHGLAIAARQHGMSFIAIPAPVASTAVLVARCRELPLTGWVTGELALLGIGIARELRGTGLARWEQVIAGAADVARTGGVAILAGEVTGIGALGLARPRFVGGAAFAPGAADRAPWTGFGDAWFALPRWTYVHDHQRGWLVLAIDARDAGDRARWRDELADHLTALGSGAPGTTQPPAVAVHGASPDQWRAQVEAITDAIARGECSKIVAARTCSVVLSGGIRLAALLTALGERHADCVRVLVRPPGASTLVAATPERLVRREGPRISCDALAGTIRSTEPDAAAVLLARAKDRREHELVVRAIRRALEAAGASVEAPSRPLVRALRDVLHLHTPFRALLHEPRHVLELAARLHPTPAVGGTPAGIASAWIRSHEPTARGWYSAPVGWFDLDGNGELAVAIRSGLVTGSRARLWAGAGIVAGSDPDRELAETELKLGAMLGALGVTT